MNLKPILTFVLFISLGSALMAQDKAVSFGVKAGPNITWLDREMRMDFRKLSNRAMLAAGATAYININADKFTLQPGIAYTIKGGKTTQTLLVDDIRFDTYGRQNLHYIQVPINIIYNFDSNTDGWFIGLGAYAARGIRAIFSPSTIEGYPLNGTQKQNLESYYKRTIKFGSQSNDTFKAFDYGISFLGGRRFKNGLTFNIEYYLGLNNIENTNYSPYIRTRNRTLNVGLGYDFR
jgi:hypothetical protein